MITRPLKMIFKTVLKMELYRNAKRFAARGEPYPTACLHRRCPAPPDPGTCLTLVFRLMLDSPRRRGLKSQQSVMAIALIAA